MYLTESLSYLSTRGFSKNDKINQMENLSKKDEEIIVEGLNHEPEMPIVKTAIPGPKSLALQSHISKIQVKKITLKFIHFSYLYSINSPFNLKSNPEQSTSLLIMKNVQAITLPMRMKTCF